MGERLDVTGMRFGMLTAIKDVGKNKHGTRNWECACDCGKLTIVNVARLRSGHTSSCGCLHTNRLGDETRTHGLSSSPELYAHAAMVARCRNPKNMSYKHYGGRGICVCERWAVFINFYSDMGLRPSKGMTVDRINNNGHYSCGKCEECLSNGWPMNCRWATQAQQSVNKRNNRFIDVNGEVKCITEWCRITGVNLATARTRLGKGVPAAQVFLAEKVNAT